METNELLKHHERKFGRTRLLVKVLLVVLLLLIIGLQYDHILQLFNHL
ncbi:MAG TPA: hypothetical protein VM802_03755 [Chitinophaga sp.]|nr:hypothetical protein [Chitinophaga sp.]HVI43950.1 hypothetical protein [Chitinophaga sp.]